MNNKIIIFITVLVFCLGAAVNISAAEAQNVIALDLTPYSRPEVQIERIVRNSNGNLMHIIIPWREHMVYTELPGGQGWWIPGGQPAQHVVNHNFTVNTLDGRGNVISSREVPFELELTYAIYSGKNYHFVFFARSNVEEQIGVEIMRIVKYDKEFNRLDALSLFSSAGVGQTHSSTYYGNTVFPFLAPFGAVFAPGGRMTQNGDLLIVHMGRRVYDVAGHVYRIGEIHVAQLYLFVDINTMSLMPVQPPWATRTREHFPLIHDDGRPVFMELTEHDNPRELVIHRGLTDVRESDMSYERTHLYRLSDDMWHGSAVELGGFGASDYNYIATARIRPTPTTDFPNLYVLIQPNDFNLPPHKVPLAVYESTTIHATLPQLIRLDNNRFVALWREGTRSEEGYWVDLGFRVRYIDGNGNLSHEWVRHSNLNAALSEIFMTERVLAN